jgi:hypothetical protein
LFRLRKWFLDCVTPGGEALIVYVAVLRWGLLRLGYSATLHCRAGVVAQSTRIGRPAAPSLAADCIDFADARLGVRGRWRGARQTEERVLWSSPRGDVRWHCHLPMAAVELELAGRTLHGTGYVEHLALEVAPWHLPIEELRWGRFHGGRRSLVWIQWSGPAPLRLCLLDGQVVAATAIDDEGLRLASGERLQFAAPQVLRDGALGRTVLAQRLLRWLPLPRAVRAMRETKLLAPGSLHGANGVATGTALHEVVRWA